MTRSFRHKLFELAAGYGSNRSGGLAVWTALVLPVLIAGAALSIDASRMYNLDRELQSAADALARAGAYELDQRADSIARANLAIASLVKNSQKFGDQADNEIKPETVRFLHTLPENDYDPVTEDMVTTEPSEARFVEVTVVPEEISLIFPKAVGSSVTSATLSARSVARAESGVCQVAPVFVCNPFEGTNTSIYTAMDSLSFQRQLIEMKTTKTKYGPGNFGFLDPFDNGGGASQIGDTIAVDKPQVCMSKTSGVNLRTGNIASLRNAFNVRFDIYEGSYKKKKSDPAYAPAANVVKGYSGNGCNSSPDSDAMALPRDFCFDDDSCPNMGGRQGDGNWDFAEYVRVNHNAANSLTINGTIYNFDHDAGTVSPSSLPSRYQVYRWEIESGSIPGDVSYGNASTPEEGTPQCHINGPSTSDIDRRVMYAAVLNCTAIENSVGMNGSVEGLPVETFVKFFITEPMGKGQDNTLWGEIIGPVVEGQDSVARDRVSVTR